MSYISDNFHKWKPEIHHYSNGRKAVEYITEEDGYPESVCIATINLPDEHIEDDEVIIKNYSETEGYISVYAKGWSYRTRAIHCL